MEQFLTFLGHLYPTPRLIGYAVAVALFVVAIKFCGRDLTSFLTPNVATDLGHSFWFPVFAFFVAAPWSLLMAQIVLAHAPYLYLNLLVDQPVWLNVIVWFTVSDFVQYWMHRLFHGSRLFWRFHRLHHSQEELNPLTTWRVHWVEITILNTVSFFVSLVLGNFTGYHAMIIGIMAASQFLQHSSLDWTYGAFGRVFVSPGFHARHHSSAPVDRDVNFGVSLAIWDHLFGTAGRSTAKVTSFGLGGGAKGLPRFFLLQQLHPLPQLLARAGAAVLLRARSWRDAFGKRPGATNAS
jgi:sterol desaturase/sphingolipid hydroxylase (fatty acid hydroxylase superfamily)